MSQPVVTQFNIPLNRPLKHSDEIVSGSKSIRLIYMGQIPGWQTQAVYHTVAELMTEETPDTIIISQPADSYVCLGYHQHLDHIFDQAASREKNIPIIRRKIGGGGTFLNPDQLFYQCVFHSSRVPANSDQIYKQMLTPIVNALSHYEGVEAQLVGNHEIEVQGKRIAGIGGGQIGEASVVVGNILFDFDFETAAAMWSVPNEQFRNLAKDAMRDHIITLDELGLEIAIDQVADQLVVEYEEYFQRQLNPSGMSMAEIERAGQVGALLRSDSFLNQVDEDSAPPNRKPLKIARDVFIHFDSMDHNGQELSGSFRVESGQIHSVDFEKLNQELENILVGQKFSNWKKILADKMGASV